MSTLLSELDSSPSNDGDLVNTILNEMNGNGSVLPPPTPAQMVPPNQGMISAQMSNTGVGQRMMDNAPATAHIIGGAQPTAADFASAMQHNGSTYASVPQQQQQQQPVFRPAKRSLMQRFTEEFKTPLLVAVLVFVFSLPVVNFLFAHYIPSMVLPTGQLTTIGLVIKCLGAGATFWVLQRIIVPFLSL